MEIFIGALTTILVLTCIILVLLVLMQKSKQDQGLGTAFGGAAAEQAFGAGATSVLTRLTIWGIAIFFVITVILAVYDAHEHAKANTSKVLSVVRTNELPQKVGAPTPPEAGSVVSNAPPPSAIVLSNLPPTQSETNDVPPAQ